MFQLRNRLTVAFLALAVAPFALSAQVRHVVSKEVSVGSNESSLRLEFEDNGTLEISFSGGQVYVDGEVVGSFVAGDQLESEWRELLGRAISLENGALAEMLTDWTASADLAGELADVAQEVDRALEQALSSIDVSVQADGGTVSLSVGDDASFVRAILRSTSRLGLMQQALEGVGNNVRIHIEEDVFVPAGTRVEGSLVAIGSDVRIEGEVDGDVVVVDGTLELLDGSRIDGDVRLADARLVRNLGEIEGGLVDVLEDEREIEAELRDNIRAEVAQELRGELRREIRNLTRSGDHGGSTLMAPFRPVIRGVGGLFENLVAILVLGIIGAVAVAFGGSKVEVIAETAHKSPGRAAMVGFAGTLLLLPVWLLGALALVVSIIGIPVAIAWVPLFPLAACAAAVLGYLAVARNTGEWLSDSGYPWTGWIRKSNPIVTVFGGVAGLMVLFMAANVVSIAPFLHFLSGLLVFAGVVVTIIAVQIGFGAVILTRGGRRREWPDPMDVDAAWEAAMDVDVEIDPTPMDDDVAEERGDDA